MAEKKKISEFEELTSANIDETYFILVAKAGDTNYKLKLQNLLNSPVAQVSNDSMIEIVTSLPSSGEANKIYLVANTNGQANDIFSEYIWVNNSWEYLGHKYVTLTDYYTKEEVNALIENLQAQINNLTTNG